MGSIRTRRGKLLADAKRDEARQKFISFVTDKAFSGTYKNGHRITYRFLNEGKVAGMYDAGPFFGIPSKESCSEKWLTDGVKMKFNCDFGLGGSNFVITARLDDASLVYQQKTWTGVETVRLTHE